MKFYIQESENIIDRLSKPETAIAAVPEYEEMFHELKDIRNFFESLRAEGGKMGGSGPIRWVARLPRAVWLAWTSEDPDLLYNKRKFFKKLDKHPYYATYRRQ